MDKKLLLADLLEAYMDNNAEAIKTIFHKYSVATMKGLMEKKADNKAEEEDKKDAKDDKKAKKDDKSDKGDDKSDDKKDKGDDDKDGDKPTKGKVPKGFVPFKKKDAKSDDDEGDDDKDDKGGKPKTGVNPFVKKDKGDDK